MIKKLSLLFGSKMKAQEILLLLHDQKPVIRQGFYQDEIPKIEKFCKENNLHFVKSNFKVLLADETNFSNKGIRIPETDKRPGMFFTYISKDEQKAWLAAYYEVMSNDLDLGRTLGYPDCCTKFFVNTFSKENPNPAHQPTNPWTNLTKREQDACLLSHFPCSSVCQESIELAKQYCETLRKVDKEHIYDTLDQLTPSE